MATIVESAHPKRDRFLSSVC